MALCNSRREWERKADIKEDHPSTGGLFCTFIIILSVQLSCYILLEYHLHLRQVSIVQQICVSVHHIPLADGFVIHSSTSFENVCLHIHIITDRRQRQEGNFFSTHGTNFGAEFCSLSCSRLGVVSCGQMIGARLRTLGSCRWLLVLITIASCWIYHTMGCAYQL